MASNHRSLATRPRTSTPSCWVSPDRWVHCSYRIEISIGRPPSWSYKNCISRWLCLAHAHQHGMALWLHPVHTANLQNLLPLPGHLLRSTGSTKELWPPKLREIFAPIADRKNTNVSTENMLLMNCSTLFCIPIKGFFTPLKTS